VRLRPSDLHLRESADNALHGIVTTVLYAGTHVVCEIAVGERTLRAHAPLDVALRPGQRVPLHLPPDSLLALAE
jgi:ABC-type sugar transport system ATPase subunit